MRLRMNPERKRRINELTDALDENTKSKAIDRAAEFSIAMFGANEFDQGVLNELFEAADEQGALTAREIAEILDTDAVPISYESSWSIDD